MKKEIYCFEMPRLWSHDDTALNNNQKSTETALRAHHRVKQINILVDVFFTVPIINGV